ncbi:UDP-N-acetylmuramate dehydrogenase [Herbivorax sp. ANBcel31]|uniref:UDP-N-acetylmuramate dehydrogenase n=1 Tax=Herbivorax sp. ANBcel31 TaxID=3069754 RepID=UPI0027AF94DF|nr:UDP-N-acetylmuramate dehydrogenase [Herbivorax sp. ANBcel31]MDQ2086140.1 UDP-N-acetylmuramate dehydrogenase [Herbivorax sp. ANBcel31]
MDKKSLASIIENILGNQNVMIDEPMKNHSSFKVGGTADILVTPVSFFQLSEVLKLCKKENIPIFIMGNGSNLIVSDKGIRGVVVKISDNLSECSVKDGTILVQGGMLLSKVSRVALENELTGLEFAAGIPGTIGGAVAMNAGAYGGEMKDVVACTEYMDLYGEIKTLRGSEHKFGYRSSYILKNSGIVLKSLLKLKKGKKGEIKALMDDFNKRRKDKQPLDMPSAGSVFKRPEGYFAGKLIEDCNLKGCKIGGAQVSEKHCGFIVNTGSATASDIQNLIEHIQNTVKSTYGVELQTEVRVIGEQ